MILHLQGVHNASDPFLINFNKIFPNENIVVRFSDGEKKITVIIHEEKKQYKSIKDFTKDFDFSKVSVVVVHYLDFEKELFLFKYISVNIPIIWWMYGGDLYRRLWLNGYKLYAPQTLDYVYSKTINPIRYLRQLRFKLRQRYLDNNILQRIIGVIPCAMPDYTLACSLLNRNIDLVDISPKGIINDLDFSNGNDICVGHSASLTSNHLYALELLKNVDIGESNIYLPLSYSIQSEKYRNAVVEKYSLLFGEKVHFLLEYQDISTYRKSYLNYKLAIFPCWRQEALGNISICFQLGVKVFLSIHNPCYEFFKEQGYYVYSIESIRSSDDLNPLTIEQKKHNLEIYKCIKAERDSIVPTNLRRYFIKYINDQNNTNNEIYY